MLQTFPAALVARMLDVQADDTVLDMCAAPGGKVGVLALAACRPLVGVLLGRDARSFSHDS